MKPETEFICLGSGSGGNAFIFKYRNECILVECGLEYKRILNKMLENDISLETLKAVIVTHEHSDHTKSIKNFHSLGIDIYAPAGTITKLGLEGENVHSVADKDKIGISDWLKIYCFPVCHDCEAFGYAFLNTDNCESILFVNDTTLFNCPEITNIRFDYIFIECNHIRKQLEAIICNALGRADNNSIYKYKRQAAYHMSLAACKKFLKPMKLSGTKAIFLMHLSKEVCNDVIIKEEIRAATGVKTYVCYASGGIN